MVGSSAGRTRPAVVTRVTGDDRAFIRTEERHVPIRSKRFPAHRDGGGGAGGGRAGTGGRRPPVPVPHQGRGGASGREEDRRDVPLARYVGLARGRGVVDVPRRPVRDAVRHRPGGGRVQAHHPARGRRRGGRRARGHAEGGAGDARALGPLQRRPAHRDVDRGTGGRHRHHVQPGAGVRREEQPAQPGEGRGGPGLRRLRRGGGGVAAQPQRRLLHGLPRGPADPAGAQAGEHLRAARGRHPGVPGEDQGWPVGFLHGRQ